MQAEASPAPNSRVISSARVEVPHDWSWNDGIGFLPLEGRAVPYDEPYFEKYVRMGDTTQGQKITDTRIDFLVTWVEKDHTSILDIGIGSGHFLTGLTTRWWPYVAHKHWSVYGTDVNPVGIEWLKTHKLFAPEDLKANVLTFWDVLEHIPDPSPIFNHHQPEWIFAAMPIYHNEEHVFRSKHYKPGEHCWYFTEAGFRRWMASFGYICVGVNAREIVQGGREDIWSFVFRRREDLV